MSFVDDDEGSSQQQWSVVNNGQWYCWWWGAIDDIFFNIFFTQAHVGRSRYFVDVAEFQNFACASLFFSSFNHQPPIILCTWYYVLYVPTRNTPPPHRRFGSSYLINERFTYYRRLNYYDLRPLYSTTAHCWSVERGLTTIEVHIVVVINDNTTYLVTLNYTITSK